ncbi:MAG: permease [Coriobacteriia bacterium]|nr:permease [Coriobacteriia bacterium]
MQEFIDAVESTYTYIGSVLSVIYGATLIVWFLRKRSAAVEQWWQAMRPRLGLPMSDRAKKIIVWVVSIFSVALYIYCTVCTKVDTEVKGEHAPVFWDILVSFSIKVLPFFVFGCVLSAIIARLLHKRAKLMPTSMFGAGIFASIMPICSCAAVPFSYSLLATKRVPLRAVVCFMVIVPVLNPFVISFGYGVLGWEYTMWRIVSVWLLAYIAGYVVERFAGEVDQAAPEAGVLSCKGCSGGMSLDGSRPIWESAFRLLSYLTPYILIGTILGTVITVYLPPRIVGDYLSSSFLGLVLASGIGLPLFLCSGEDVLMLEPLMKMGLPMGHAIALTLAGNGICISSIALLFPLFGRRATWIITGLFFFGSIAIGLAINAISPLLS